jgi:hypothetical protein
MSHAEIAAKAGAAGVLDASALAFILGGMERFLVPVGRIVEQRHAQEQ